jgi:hypothetical protein
MLLFSKLIAETQETKNEEFETASENYPLFLGLGQCFLNEQIDGIVFGLANVEISLQAGTQRGHNLGVLLRRGFLVPDNSRIPQILLRRFSLALEKASGNLNDVER